MTTKTLTLTEFLLSRIAEDEDFARAAASASAREWLPRSYRVVTADLFEVGELAVPTSAHVARHDPARVLAECEAKRRVVEYAESAEESIEGEWSYTREENQGWLILSALAAVYAGHPDYHQEWKP